MNKSRSFPTLLTRFFSERLINQRHASAHTIGSYRDTFRLLLRFVLDSSGTQPSDIRWEELDAPLIARFLDTLQQERGISARSRNLRLTAIRSFYRFTALELPEHAEIFERILAIPAKRHVCRQVSYLTRDIVDALLAAPDQRTWAGQRDHVWMLLTVQTGLRASELTGLTRSDVHLGAGAYVHVLGKGRKERCVPLAKSTVTALTSWLALPAVAVGSDILFPNRRGTRMSTDGLQYLLKRHVAKAQRCCPALTNQPVTPHVLRHTAAMELLQAGVDTTVIALWLGHESVTTTHIYLEADLAMKERSLALTTPHEGSPGLFRPEQDVMAFLQSL